MSKVYKGYELIKEIAEGNIKNNQKFDVLNKDGCLWIKNATINEIKILDLLEFKFELIEDQTIDIDSIKEIDTAKTFDYSMTDVFEWNNEMEEKINQVIRAVKHLNKEIQSIKK